MVSKKSDLLICDDYLQFQNHLKELRKLDDLIINTLNSGSIASKQCQKLGDEIFPRISYRTELISSCLSHTNDLITQNNSNDIHRQTLIFQRRQLENEKNFEAIIRTNIEKAFYQHCRDY